jgi:hypothetical protein
MGEGGASGSGGAMRHGQEGARGWSSKAAVADAAEALAKSRELMR